MKTWVRIASVVLAIVVTMLVGGCSSLSKCERDTALGAAVGGVAGSVVTDGSTVGTVGGAVAGGVIGNRAGKKKC